MIRQIFLALGALTAFHLAAGSGIASDAASCPVPAAEAPAPDMRTKLLAHFISALTEKDPDQQCLKLIDVIAMAPDDAEAPFAAFQTAFSKAKDRKKILEKFDSIQNRSPRHPLLVLHAVALHRACGAKAEVLLKKAAFLLESTPAKLMATASWDPGCTSTLYHCAALAMIETGNYEKLPALFKKWENAPYPHKVAVHLAFAEPCFVAAARAYALNKTALAKDLEKCFQQALTTFEVAQKLTPDRKRDAGILLFYTKFKPLFPGKAIEFARNYDTRVNSAESNYWLMNTAWKCGSIKDLDKAVAGINEMNPRFNAADLRVKCFINAKNFAEAAKELKKVPEEKRLELQILLYSAKKDWKGLYAFLSERLSKGTAPDLHTGVLLLSIAEHLGDKNIFYQGLKIIAPQLHVPELANAAGYISAVLGIELPRARQLLAGALKQQPRNAAFLDSMAWIAFKEKRFAEAEKWINKAFHHMLPNEGVAVIFEHAGDIAAAQGKSPLPYYRLSLKYAAFDNEFEKETVLKKMKAFK